MLIEYIRKGTFNPNRKPENKGRYIGNREKRGVLIAKVCEEDTVRIGWSLCNIRAGDRFNKVGLDIAINRATARPTEIPQSIRTQYKKFVERAEKYYKDKILEINVK